METNNTKYLTPAVLELFDALVSDAGNWSGMPLFGGNVGTKPEDKGYLANLKKAGLVTTEVDEDNRNCSWVIFTPKGIELINERRDRVWEYNI